MRLFFQKQIQLWILILLFIAVGIGFFVPISRNLWLGILCKSILFLFIFFVLYSVFITPVSQRDDLVESEKDEKTLHGIAAPPEGFNGTGDGFGDTFRRYVHEFLSVVRRAFVASYAGFYLKKAQGRIEFQMGESEDGFLDGGVSTREGGLIDRVAKQGMPILEANLPGKTVFEGVPDSEIRSFTGVPLFWENNTLGVLAVGSRAASSFSEEDADFLLKYGELITRVMAMCHKGLKWESEQRIYRMHLHLEKALEKAADEDSVISEFVQVVKKVFSFERFSLCVKEGEEGVVRYAMGQADSFDKGFRFPLDEGLNGWIMKRNAPLIIGDMEEGDYVRPRYARNEDSKHGMHSFLGIPLGSGEGAWGCLNLESRSVNEYGEKEKEVLAALAVPLKMSLKRHRLLRQLKGQQNHDKSRDLCASS